MHDQDPDDPKKDDWLPIAAAIEGIVQRLSQDGAVGPDVLRSALVTLAFSDRTPLVAQHYGLTQAARKFFPDGSITRRSLLTEIHKGRLHAKLVAGKYLVTESDIRNMLEACTCKGVDAADAKCPQGYTFATAQEESQPTSLSTERVKLAQASARANLAALKKPSKAISPANTDHKPVRLRSAAS